MRSPKRFDAGAVLRRLSAWGIEVWSRGSGGAEVARAPCFVVAVAGASGAGAFLAKPIGVTPLAAEVRRLLG